MEPKQLRRAVNAGKAVRKAANPETVILINIINILCEVL